MPTPGERRALIFIAAVGALGVAVRGWKEIRPSNGSVVQAGDRAGLARQIAAVDSAVAAGGVKRAERLAATGQDGPPKRGAKKGKPKVARDSQASSDARPEHSMPPPPAAPRTRRPPRPTPAQSPGADERATDPRPPRRNARPEPRPPIDLDIAPIDEVAAVAQIGPGLARRIVRDRIERGPFGSIDGLLRIPGISPGLARRLQPYVTFSLSPRPDSAAAPRSPVRRGRRRGAR